MPPHEIATSAPWLEPRGSTAPPDGLSAPPGPEAIAEFLLRLRARGVRDLAVLRAMEAIPRRHFVPYRYADLATRDLALPIACGQTMSEPFVIARMLEALAATPASRVLEIGAGSGYTSALLARLCLDVLAIERYQGLATQSRTRLHSLGVGNAAVVWGDGLEVPSAAGSFDRLVIHAVVDRVPDSLKDRVAEDGIMVYARSPAAGSAGKQQLVRAVRSSEGEWTETPICRSRLRVLDRGLSLGL